MSQEILISSDLNSQEMNMGKTKIEPTDEFVKVSRYLNVIFAYHNIPLSLVPISLLLAQRMTFKTNIVDLFKEDKEEIAEMLGVSPERTRTLIRECKKFNIIKQTRTRGKFEVNAYLFSTGSMVETRELQAHFDFQKEAFIVHADQYDKITGTSVRKAVINRRDKQIPGQQTLFDLNYLGNENIEKPSEPKKKKSPSRSKNSFNSFEQNHYDPDVLEAIEDNRIEN